MGPRRAGWRERRRPRLGSMQPLASGGGTAAGPDPRASWRDGGKPGEERKQAGWRDGGRPGGGTLQ